MAALPATTDSPRSGKGIGFLAGVAAVLVLGCIGTGAAYLLDPSLFSGASVVEPPAAQPVAVASDTTANTSAQVTASSGEANANIATSQTEPAQSKTETAKPGSKKPGETKASNPDETIVEVPADEGDLPEGGMVVVKKNPDGTTSTTRIIRGGQHPPVPPNGFNPFPPGFDPSMYQYMTPEQRQKMQELMKRNVRRQLQMQKGTRVRPAPSPSPSTPE
jgi:hypothetical protein